MNPYDLTPVSMGVTSIDAMFTAVEDDGESFELRRDGEPVAVVIPVEEYHRIMDFLANSANEKWERGTYGR